TAATQSRPVTEARRMMTATDRPPAGATRRTTDGPERTRPALRGTLEIGAGALLRARPALRALPARTAGGRTRRGCHRPTRGDGARMGPDGRLCRRPSGE